MLKIKKIRKTGNSLYIPLTKELKNLGVDEVLVVKRDNVIVITTINNQNKYLIPINARLYEELRNLRKSYGEPFEEYIENLFRKEIEKHKNIFTRPIKIKI